MKQNLSPNKPSFYAGEEKQEDKGIKDKKKDIATDHSLHTCKQVQNEQTNKRSVS